MCHCVVYHHHPPLGTPHSTRVATISKNPPKIQNLSEAYHQYKSKLQEETLISFEKDLFEMEATLIWLSRSAKTLSEN